MKKIILISDSHHDLDKRIFPYLEKCDEIWHAGDIGKLEIIDKLRTFAKVRAVYGNIDGSDIRNEFLKIEYFNCEQLKVIMTHIGGYPGKYENGIRKILKERKPDLFISGHSHILKIMHDKKLNILHMNPGAIGNYGAHIVKTMIAFNVAGKAIKNLRVMEYSRKNH